jgi:hypothetical protein
VGFSGGKWLQIINKTIKVAFKFLQALKDNP